MSRPESKAANSFRKDQKRPLRRFVLAQYHQGQMTVPRLVTLLRGLRIVVRLLIGLAKTCFKLGIGFWDYLGTRLNVPECQAIPPFSELVLAKARPP
jgi:hypothetical protein